MDIHEHQAKEILAGFGVPVPKGGVAYSPEQAAYRARELGGDLWVVKAQIHSGGRGEAGGVKLCRSEEEVRSYAAIASGQVAGHETDGRGRQGRLPPLGRGGARTSRANSISASCSTGSPSAS